MQQHIAHISLVVRDYDEAIQFYTQKLGFRLVEDTRLSETKRWVLVAPPDTTELDPAVIPTRQCHLLLVKAATEEQASRIGNQTGGRVFLFLYTDDFWRDYRRMQEKEIRFVRPPKEEVYGTVTVFEDLYGNLWDLLERGGKDHTNHTD